MSLVDTISAMKVQPWNRLTMADGQWLQEKTVQQLDERDIELAKAIDELSGGSGPTYSEWYTSSPSTPLVVGEPGNDSKLFAHGKKFALSGADATVVARSTSGFFVSDSNIGLFNCSADGGAQQFARSFGIANYAKFSNTVSDSILNLDTGSEIGYMSNSLAFGQNLCAKGIYDSILAGGHGNNYDGSDASLSHSLLFGAATSAKGLVYTGMFGDNCKFNGHAGTLSYNLFVGPNNDISTNVTRSIVFGGNNYLTNNVTDTAIFGSRNNVQQTIQHSYINGDDNEVDYTAKYLFVAGSGNRLNYTVDNTYVNGNDNKLNSTVRNSIFAGHSNTFNSTVEDLTCVGNNNYGTNISGGVIVGNNNSASGSSLIGNFAGIGNNLHIKGGFTYSVGQDISACGYCGAVESYAMNIGKNIKQFNAYQLNVGEDLLTEKTYVVNVGKNNISQGNYELTVGEDNKNYKEKAAVIGTGLWNYNDNSLVIGKYNVRYNDSLLEIGYGSSDSDSDRKTIFRVDTSGGVWCAGDIHLENGQHIIRNGSSIL